MEDLENIQIDFELNKNIFSENNNSLNSVLELQKRGSEVNVVCLSSMTFDSILTEAIVGLKHYETRCLWEISKVKKSGTVVHFFSKYKIRHEALEHFYQAFDFSEEEKNRVFLYSVESILGEVELDIDLSDYVLKNEKVRRVFKSITLSKNCYLECFVLTAKELEISKVYNLPSFWMHHRVDYFKTKSGNRFLLKNVTKVPDGIGDLYSIEDVVSAVLRLHRKTQSKKMVIKLNDGVSGDGNGFFHLPEKVNVHSIRQSLIECKFVSSKMTYTKFFKEFAKLGGVVEIFVEGPKKASPSVQLFLKPDMTFEILSSHEQVLDDSGSRFLGARFPAYNYHRSEITLEAEKVAKKLIEQKIFGIVGLDFLTISKANKIETYLIEINLRKGGTTHPYWTAKAALDASTCELTGRLKSSSGNFRLYHSNDNLLVRDQRRKRSLGDFLLKMRKAGISYDHKSQKGAIFHMLNSWEPDGKIGAVFIGESDEEIEFLQNQAIKTIG